MALEKAPAKLFAFVENGEASFRDMTNAIGQALGLGEAEPMDADEAIARWGREPAVFALGSNSRVRAKRARALGWTPKCDSVVKWILEEL